MFLLQCQIYNLIVLIGQSGSYEYLSTHYWKGTKKVDDGEIISEMVIIIIRIVFMFIRKSYFGFVFDHRDLSNALLENYWFKLIYMHPGILESPCEKLLCGENELFLRWVSRMSMMTSTSSSSDSLVSSLVCRKSHLAFKFSFY